MNLKQAVEALKYRVRVEDLLGCEHQDHEHVVPCQLPGHNDRGRPNLRIYPETNSVYCWGCNTGADVIKLHQLLGNFSRPIDAIKDLAERYGIDMDPPTAEEQAKLDAQAKREAVLEIATAFYHKQLMECQAALNYLTKERGFTLETIQQLRMGWANRRLLAAVGGMSDKLKEQGLDLQAFIDVGLVVDKDKDGNPIKPRDFFFDRILFPLIEANRVVGLSGRAWPQGEPKYLNMMKDPKRVKLGAPLALYNGDATRKSVVDVGEGLPDTVTLIQWGIDATGSPGTGGVHQHAERFRKCRKVRFPWDTDAAGQREVIKSATKIQEALDDGQCYIVKLPATVKVKDVNEYFLNGATKEDYLALPEVPLIQHMIEQIDPKLPAAERRVLIQPTYKLIARLSLIEQEEYFDLLKNHLKVPKNASRAEVKKILEAPKPREEEKGADEPAFKLTFKRRRLIVPAQDFVFNSPATGNVAVYLSTERTVVDDSGSRTVEGLEPFLIRSIHNGGDVKIDFKNIQQMGLSRDEMKRVPFASMVAGRWRPEGQFPYSLERFIGGQIKEVNGAELFDDIEALFRRYIWLPDPRDYKLLAAWTMMTYVYRLFDAIGYLQLHGVRESGKSQILRLLELICFNAKKSSSATESAMFRSLEANCRTFFVDEAEKLNNPQPGTPAHDLMLLCNDGYKKGGGAERVEKNEQGNFETVFFDTYSPKVFASIAELNYVLASRCIKISCLRATHEEALALKDFAQNSHREIPVIEDIRDRLYCWMLLHFPDVQAIYSEGLLESPALAHLKGREREMWLPLFTIAQHVDMARYGESIRQAAVLAPDQFLCSVLAELQRTKEEERRSHESDVSLDLLILTQLYELVTSGELQRIRVGDGQGDWYPFKESADLISDRLKESGATWKEEPCSSRKLAAALLKTQVIGEADKSRLRVGGGLKRAFLLRLDDLKERILRNGGRLEDPPQQQLDLI